MKDLSNKEIDIKKESDKIAIHSFFGAFSIFIISFMDGIFLSIKSEIDFSVSIISAPLIFLILSCFIGISNGLVVYLSKNRENKRSTKIAKANGVIFLMLFFSLLTIFLFYINLDNLINLIGIPEELQEKSKNYINWHYIGLPFCIYISLVGSKIKGLGNAKTLSKLMLASAIINITLDPIFIFYFNLGAEGAAMSTVFSWIIVAISYFIKNLNNKDDSFKITYDKITSFFHLLPSFIVGQLLNVILGVVTIYFINQYSLNEISAYGFTFRLEKFITILAFSYSSAVIMIGGQNIEKKEKIASIFQYSLKQTLILNFIYILILNIGIEPFAILCGLSEKSASLSSLFIQILSVGYLFNSITQVYSGYLYIKNKHNVVMFSNIIKVFIFLPLFIYIGNNLFGYEGIMYGTTVSFILSFLFLIMLSRNDFKMLITKKENNSLTYKQN